VQSHLSFAAYRQELFLSFLFSKIRKEKEKSFALWMNLVAKIFLLFCFFR